jgi:orotidine-5'-phosphate decarboxylase
MRELLIALDVDTADRACELTDQLGAVAGGFKIGSQLFTGEGPSIVRRVVEDGHRVFLDLKYHDIPNTVSHAVRVAADLGVWMLTVHAAGGTEMLAAAHDAATRHPHAPLVVAVTVLTSFGDSRLQEIGVPPPISGQVTRLASLAQEAGVDGVVASPLEIELVTRQCGGDFTIVTPGIRQAAQHQKGRIPGEDQIRTMSAGDAMRAGAHYLVVGRPVVAAADPKAAALAIERDVRERGQ